MRRRLFILFIVLFFILILSQIANAEIIVNKYNIQEDFLVSSNNAVIKACACSTFLDVLTVKNIGNVVSTYKISSDSKYNRLYPDFFILEPNQQIQIWNYVGIPCNSGDFVYNVLVSTEKGLQKVMRQQVIVIKCQNLLLSPIIDKANIEPCQNATFSFLINNTDGFTEIYSFTLDRFSEYALFTENPVVVESMKSKQVSFVIKPDCKYYGHYNLTLIAEAENNKFKAFMPLSLDINPNYEFSLSGSDNIETCYKDESSFEYGILNLAEFNNDYIISLDAPKWIKLSANKFSLEPNQKGIFSLNIKPEEIGVFNIKLKARSKLGNLEAVKNITLIVDDCYNFDLYFVEDNICKDDKEMHLVLNNNGKFNENFELSLLAPDFITLADEFVYVPKNSSRGIVINIAEDGKYDKYYLEAKARIPGKEFSTKASINLDIVPLKDCYKPKLTPRISFITYKTEEIQFDMENIGTKGTTYDITSEKSDWILIPDKKITAEPGEIKNLDTVSYPNGDIKGGLYKVKFHLWSEDAKQMYNFNYYLVLCRYDLVSAFSNYKYCVIAFIAVLAVIIFLIVLLAIRKKIKRKKVSKNVKKLSIIFLILFVLFGIGIAFYCLDLQKPISTLFSKSIKPLTNESIEEVEKIEEEAEEEIEIVLEPIIEKELCEDYKGQYICNSSLYHKWYKNNVYKIDLLEYFFDPDGNELIYAARNGEDMKIEIEGSMATITPDLDFVGVNEVIFTAKDPEGLSATSARFVLHVMEGKPSIFERIKNLFR